MLIRLSVYDATRKPARAAGVIEAEDGKKYQFYGGREAGEWVTTISSSAPAEAIEAVGKSLLGKGGKGPVVVVPGAGARVSLEEFGPSYNQITGTLVIGEDGAEFPINCQNGQFCKPPDLYGDEHAAICAGLAKLVAACSGEIPIEVIG
jgi:hypothetical protein